MLPRWLHQRFGGPSSVWLPFTRASPARGARFRAQDRPGSSEAAWRASGLLVDCLDRKARRRSRKWRRRLRGGSGEAGDPRDPRQGGGIKVERRRRRIEYGHAVATPDLDDSDGFGAAGPAEMVLSRDDLNGDNRGRDHPRLGFLRHEHADPRGSDADGVQPALAYDGAYRAASRSSEESSRTHRVGHRPLGQAL